MLRLQLSREGPVPLYRQIATQLRKLIERGSLQAGTRLPPIRRLAKDSGVTRLTVQTAYTELQEGGWIESVVGRGTFVSATCRPVWQSSRPAPISLSGPLAELLHVESENLPLQMAQAVPASETFPERDFKLCLQAAAQSLCGFTIGPLQGDEGLRSELSRLLLARGLAVSPTEMLVVSGAQQGIDVILRALTCPDELIAVESPTYPGVLELLRSRSQNFVEIPMDRDGLSIEALEALCRRYPPALLYTVPTFHNPTGLVLSDERRRRLLWLADRYGFRILEDDVYGFLSFSEPTPPALRSIEPSDKVIYLNGFSKILAPSLRLGVVVAPPAELTAITARKHTADLVSSMFLQRALAEYLRRGLLEPHLQQVRHLYRTRRDALLSALSDSLPECSWTVPQGGLSAWLELPADASEEETFQSLRERGLALARGAAFFALPHQRGHFRLGFARNSCSQIRDAVRVLATVLHASSSSAQSGRGSALEQCSNRG